jgi:hypothetical protein
MILVFANVGLFLVACELCLFAVAHLVQFVQEMRGK